MQINFDYDLVGGPLGSTLNRPSDERQAKRMMETGLGVLAKPEMPRPAEMIAKLFKPLEQNLSGYVASPFLPRLSHQRRTAPATAKTAATPKQTFHLENYRSEIDPKKFAILARVLGSVSVGLTREEVEEEYDIREE